MAALRIVRATALGMCVLAAACVSRSIDASSDLGSSANGDLAVADDLDDFIEKYTSAICARSIGCQQVPAVEKATCIEYTTAYYLPLPPMPATGIAQGTYAFDATAAEACLNAIANADCTTIANASLPVCAQVVHGILLTSAACQFGVQCAGGFCDISEGCEEAVCGGGVPVGEDCSSAACVPGDFCAQPSNLCTLDLAAGSACDSTYECANGFCIGAPNAAMGMCQPPGNAGDPCLDHISGIFGIPTCADGYTCDVTQATPACVPVPTLGQACSQVGACDYGLACVGAVGRPPAADGSFVPYSAGTCVTALSIGSACSTDDSMGTTAPCPAFTACTNGTCQPRAIVGDACVYQNQITDCLIGYCDPTTLHCKAWLPENASCDPTGSAFQCARGNGNAPISCDPSTNRCDVGSTSCSST